MGNNLKQWDGKYNHYQYDVEAVESWNMQIDDDGNIWYMTKENPPKLEMWCSSDRLARHLFHLEQIEARRPNYNA